ncbi:MAG: hypothetical protein ACKODT_07970 [Fluviibacter sp.]
MSELRDRIAVAIKESYDSHCNWPYIFVDNTISEWMADAVVDVIIDMAVKGKLTRTTHDEPI